MPDVTLSDPLSPMFREGLTSDTNPAISIILSFLTRRMILNSPVVFNTVKLDSVKRYARMIKDLRYGYVISEENIHVPNADRHWHHNIGSF